MHKVGLCVNPNEDYAKVKAADGYVYYMACALLDTVLGKLANAEEGTPAYEVLETFKGTDLEYKEYEPLFPFVELKKKAYYVVCDSYVTLTDGTGVVHIAPAFGEDDSNVGRKYDLPFLQLVDEKGEMTEETPWAGTFCKKADPMVLKDLEEKDALFSDFKAVKEGNVWCTGKYLYQATDIVGELITDMNLMLTGGDESKMTFLYHVK